MNIIKATVKDRRLDVEVPADLPDGTEVLVEPLNKKLPTIGINESEWRDDAASLADWDAWIKRIEPPEFTPEEEAQFSHFDEEMRRFNLQAVRRQMETGPLPREN